MARMTVNGTKELAAMLETLGSKTQEIAERGLYDGARVMTNALSAAVNGIPIHQKRPKGEPPSMRPERRGGLRAEDKQGLQESLGVSHMRESGGKTDLSIGFDGYNSQGRPNIVVARSLERGTSWMEPYPFVKPTVSKTRNTAREAIVHTAEAEIDKIIK